MGPYELIAPLAVGGMARVFLARHTADGGLGRLYAVKLILDHMESDTEFVRMFLDEARVASRLRHHNIVSVLEQGTYGTSGHFVAMEYIEGCTLSALLSRHPNHRPLPQLLSILADVLNGLQAAHTAVDPEGRPMQVIHRDISPSNVLIDLHGLARISDFGIAKARDRLTETQPGIYKGRFAYSAPERLLGSGRIDHRADIFSVGAMMWGALTGENLFRGSSTADTIQRVLNMKVPRPSKGRLSPPRWLDPVCLKALERNPDARYSSAGEMLRDLRRVAAEHGVHPDIGEVAEWVSSTFGAQLAARRELIDSSSADQAVTRCFQRDGLSEDDLETSAIAVDATATRKLPSGTLRETYDGPPDHTVVDRRATEISTRRNAGFLDADSSYDERPTRRVAAGEHDRVADHAGERDDTRLSQRPAPLPVEEVAMARPSGAAARVRRLPTRARRWLLLLLVLGGLALYGPLRKTGDHRMQQLAESMRRALKLGSDAGKR